jgi:hypothetical protein
LYYHAARHAYEAAQRCAPAIKKAQARIERLIAKEHRILATHDGDRYAAADELETIYIQMEDAEYAMGAAYGPLLEHLATVHILATPSVEAHVDSQAHELLSGQVWSEFDRLSIQGKWLLLPRVLGKAGFDPGKQPFQRFAQLAKLRNNLVHYKVKKEDWKSVVMEQTRALPERLGGRIQQASYGVST